MSAQAQTTPQIVMKATGLIKRYGQVTALDGADFELRAGEILAVIGDNGAGKTNILEAVSMLSPRRGPRELDAEMAHLLGLGDHLGGVVLHGHLAAELDRPRRAGFGAGRGLVDGHPVGTQRALVGLAVFLRDARDVERTTRDAIAAAHAVLIDEINDAVGVLQDGARSRTGF